MISAVGSAVTGASPDAYSVAVARKALDVQTQLGQAAVRLIERAAVSPDGKGAVVDTYA